MKRIALLGLLSVLTGCAAPETLEHVEWWQAASEYEAGEPIAEDAQVFMQVELRVVETTRDDLPRPGPGVRALDDEGLVMELIRADRDRRGQGKPVDGVVTHDRRCVLAIRARAASPGSGPERERRLALDAVAVRRPDGAWLEGTLQLADWDETRSVAFGVLLRDSKVVLLVPDARFPGLVLAASLRMITFRR